MTATIDRDLSGKRLVIFGCGYVGSELARQAVARGAIVTALTRNEAKALALRAAGVEVVVADLAGESWHERIPGAPDFAVNCVSSGGGGVDGYRRSYVGGMASILAWAQRRRAIGTMVYTSSTSVYPQGSGVRVDEDSPTTDSTDRGSILREAEAALQKNPVAFARWFVLRLAGIYGPGRHALLDQVRAGEISGRGEHRLNLIHRDDVCAAIWSVLLAPAETANEIFNVADDAPSSKAEIAAWLAARISVAPPRFTNAPGVGRRAITPDRVIMNAKLRVALGWRPRYPTFREGYENILSR